MSVKVLQRGSDLMASCGRCKSVLSFTPEDAGFLPFINGGGGSFRVRCPVCRADVWKLAEAA